MEIRKLVRVKWVGAGLAFIELTSPLFDVSNTTSKRLYATKRELLEIQNELNSFIEFYKEDFKEENLDYLDSGIDELYEQ